MRVLGAVRFVVECPSTELISITGSKLCYLNSKLMLRWDSHFNPRPAGGGRLNAPPPPVFRG